MTKTIAIPYYTSTLDLHVDEKNLKAVVTAKMHEFKADKSEEELVRDALKNPIGTPSLCELAKGKKKVVLVTSDHTRAVPSKITLPLELAEIRKGNPDADITILIATGLSATIAISSFSIMKGLFYPLLMGAGVIVSLLISKE